MLKISGLLGWWLNHLLSMCTVSFAAAGSALDLGGGDDDGGIAGGGTEGEGDLGGGDTDLGGDEGLGGEEDLEGGEQQSQQQRADAVRDSRLPAEVKKHLEELKGTNPKLANTIRQAIFAQQAWRQVVPGGIRQAREMVQAFDELGGAEGIRGIQEQAQSLEEELQSIDEAWEKADPEFIASWAEENPQAFGRVVPIALEQFRKVDKEGYSYTLSRIFVNTLQQSGVINALSSILQLAKANAAAPGMAGIVEAMNLIGDKVNGWSELAANQPERKPDQGMERLRKKEEEFDRKQFDGFKREVGAEIKTHLTGGLVRHLGKFLAQRNIKIAVLRQKEPERFQAMVAEADRRLTQALNSDRDFKPGQQKDRLVATRDKARVLTFYKKKIDYLLADPNGPQIAKKVSKVFFSGGMGGGKKAGAQSDNQGGRQNAGDNKGNQRGSQDNSVRRVGARPAPETIDWSRTTDDMILDGEAFVKGGGKVKWR